MIKKHTIVGVSLLVFGMLQSFTLHAEVRTFTSPDGRTLQAEIVAATPDRVSLKTATGQPLIVPIDKFIPADQQFINDWRKANPEQIKYRFVADYTKSKASSSKRKENNETITTERWECNMKLTNQSGQTLDGVTVDYTIYFDNIEQGNKVTRSKKGTAKIGAMKNLQQMVVKTEAIELHNVQLEGGFYYTDGSRARQKETLNGMVIHINHGGKKVFTWASSGVPKGAESIAEGTKESLIGQ